MHLNLQMRIFLERAAYGFGQVLRTDFVRCGDAQRTGHGLAGGGGVGVHFAQALEQRRDVVIEVRARFGQPQLARGACHEPYAQRGFQP